MHFINTDDLLIAKYIPHRKYNVRIRYRQELQKAKIEIKDGMSYIIFDNPQRGVSSGQFAVWYDDNGTLIGSGVIN
jgi:tRNA-specific 2-thiouridylase